MAIAFISCHVIFIYTIYKLYTYIYNIYIYIHIYNIHIIYISKFRFPSPFLKGRGGGGGGVDFNYLPRSGKSEKLKKGWKYGAGVGLLKMGGGGWQFP